MTFLTLATTLVSLATNPLVIAAASTLGAVGLTVGGYLIHTRSEAADVAQDIADLEAELEPWVAQAEAMFGGGTGKTKYSAVLQQAKAWLKVQGITGRKGALVKKYLPGLIEAAVKRVDPKLAPKKAA